MTPGQKQDRAAGPQVEPSTRDPIGEWLDVFMRLTGLSGGRRAELRAELEDHLRSRVDDLLIMGLSESEATHKAVGELGETAELARRFRHAQHAGQRRRTMQMILIGAGAAALALGVGTVLPGQSGGAAGNGAAAQPEVVDIAGEAAEIAPSMKT